MGLGIMASRSSLKKGGVRLFPGIQEIPSLSKDKWSAKGKKRTSDREGELQFARRQED